MAAKDKKICIVTEAIPPAYSGTGLVAYEFACRLYKKGQLGLVLTRRAGKYNVQFKGQKSKGSIPSELILGLPARHRIIKAGLFSRLKNIWIEYIAVSILAMWKLFRHRNSFGVIHSFGAGKPIQLCSILAGKILRKRTVLEITTVTKDSSLDFLSKKSRKVKDRLHFWFFSLADIVVTISPALSSAYRASSLDEKKIREIGNPVDTEKFYPVDEEGKTKIRESLGIDPKQIVILFVGLITKRKGIDLLIKAFSRIVTAYPDSLLILAGPISLSVKGRQEFLEEMKKVIEDSGFRDKVIFPGIVDNVDDYMKASNLFVFPSRKEGFGTVVVEAMATGLPVIAVNIPGVTSSIIDDGENGIIVFEEDPGKIETAIRKLLEDNELYKNISKNAIVKVRTIFSNDVIDKQYEQIYTE
jgi:glycosyltransferase involved in cell wall biosynthesis